MYKNAQSSRRGWGRGVTGSSAVKYDFTTLLPREEGTDTDSASKVQNFSIIFPESISNSEAWSF